MSRCAVGVPPEIPPLSVWPLQPVERPSIARFTGGTTAHDDAGGVHRSVGDETPGHVVEGDRRPSLGYHPATIAKCTRVAGHQRCPRPTTLLQARPHRAARRRLTNAAEPGVIRRTSGRHSILSKRAARSRMSSMTLESACRRSLGTSPGPCQRCLEPGLSSALTLTTFL